MKLLRSFFLTLLCLVVFIVLIVYRQNLAQYFVAFKNFISGFFDQTFSEQAFQELKLENQILKLELEDLKKSASASPYHFKRAEVFSNYPFSDNLFLVLNVGQNQGIKAGMPVFVSEDILLGKIKDTKRALSEAETIFSPDWKESVIIGPEKIKAVLKGGSVPTLELIPEEAKIKTGDSVFNISPDLPYGVFLGTIDKIENSGEPWLKAFLKTPYDFHDLNQVLIMTDYETFK